MLLGRVLIAGQAPDELTSRWIVRSDMKSFRATAARLISSTPSRKVIS